MYEGDPEVIGIIIKSLYPLRAKKNIHRKEVGPNSGFGY